MKKYKHLVVEISGICNAKCKYCTTGIKNINNIKNGGVLSKDDFIKAIDYILENNFFDKENGQLELFSWGEPFLNNQLNEICSEVSKRKIHYRLSTNASVLKYLDNENIEYLDDLCISISGFTEKSYKKIHGLDFNHVVSNIKKMSDHLRNCGYEYKIVMNFHVYQFNIGEIELAEKFCEENKITFIPHVAYLADFKYFNDFLLNKMDYKIMKEASQELMLGIFDDLNEKFDEKYICKQKNSLILDEYLNILPCAFLTSNNSLGSLFEFKTVEEIENVRESVKECETCYKSKAYYLVNQDKYFLYGYKKPTNKHLFVSPHIYINKGYGYSEENTLYDKNMSLNENGVITCKFEIPEEVISVRLDPIERSKCFIKNINIADENGNTVEFKPINGSILSNKNNHITSIYFDNTDPQIDIILSKKQKPKMLIVDMDIEKIL